MATKGSGNGHSAVRLKAVGVSEDGLSLILATRANARAGPYRLAVDESLLAQLEEARTRVLAAKERQAANAQAAEAEAAPAQEATPELPPPAPVRVESKLSVREIQSFLRQGRSVPSIAKKAGVAESWIEKFEVPIVWERAGMAARAQRATLVKSRSGASALPLGEAVQANLKARRIKLSPEAYNAAWDSTRHPKTGKWAITFTFISRRRPHVAQWQYDTENLEVHPLNKLAAELGWVQPRRRRATASTSA